MGMGKFGLKPIAVTFGIASERRCVVVVQEGQRWDKDERFHYAGYPGIYPRERGVTPVE